MRQIKEYQEYKKYFKDILQKHGKVLISEVIGIRNEGKLKYKFAYNITIKFR